MDLEFSCRTKIVVSLSRVPRGGGMFWRAILVVMDLEEKIVEEFSCREIHAFSACRQDRVGDLRRFERCLHVVRADNLRPFQDQSGLRRQCSV